MKKRICLGKIAGVHGVKGLVKIFPYGEDVSLLERLSPLYTSENGTETLSVRLKNPHGKFILAEVEGVQDRSEAEKIKGTKLFTTRDQLPDLADDAGYYYEDLIGLAVIDESGEKIGNIVAVEDFGAGDLLEIQPIQGQSFYVPFHDETIIHVDLGERIIATKNLSRFMVD